MQRPPLVDCHTHTAFSDGVSTFDQNVRAAAEAGCRIMVSTDHLTLPASMDPRAECQVPERDLAAHRAAFDQARAWAAEHACNLEFVYGFECDWYPGCEPLVRTWSEGATVRLGSVHWIGDPGDIYAGAALSEQAGNIAPAGEPGTGEGWIDYSEDKHVWDELGVREVWERYVDAWCHACESPLAFDVMAHPDLAMRFVHEGYAPDFGLAPFWDRMAACAHDTERRIEVSTAGLRKTVGDYYPARGLLERFCDAEVPITFGSDAHDARDICARIRTAQEYAASCGYTSFDAPHADGSWETFSL